MQACYLQLSSRAWFPILALSPQARKLTHSMHACTCALTHPTEGINAIKSGSLVSLSEQQLVDCDTEQDMG